MLSKSQRGNVLVIVLVLFGLLGIGIFWQKSRREAAKSEAQRIEAAARQAEEVKANAELKALQAQLEAAKSKDVLQVSLKAADDLYARWKDAKQVAGATSRIGLATPVAALQALRREADGLIVPDCLKDGKSNLMEAMRLEIEGFLAFMGDVNIGKYVARANTESADKLQTLYEADRSMCPNKEIGK